VTPTLSSSLWSFRSSSEAASFQTPVIRILEDNEPVTFKEHFADWPNSVEAQSRFARLALLGKLLEAASVDPDKKQESEQIQTGEMNDDDQVDIGSEALVEVLESCLLLPTSIAVLQWSVLLTCLARAGRPHSGRRRYAAGEAAAGSVLRGQLLPGHRHGGTQGR
jgi:hypothetical protein